MALSKVLATVLVLAVGIPPLAYAQSTPPSGTWKGVEKNKAGTWKPAIKGGERLKEIGDDVRKAGTKWYGDSPNVQVFVDTIENAVLEKVPVAGEVVGVLQGLPDHMKAGLTVWLQRKKNDAATAEDFDRMDRYDAFLSCLYGDCSALTALQQAGTGVAPSGQHSGQPEQFKIKSAVVLVPEIQEGESTRITVTFQTMIGGVVNIELQAPDSVPIGPLIYNIKDKKPGETDSRDFNLSFPTAGNYRLLVLARDARSDDLARAYVVVTGKPKFDGHYAGTIAIETKAGNKTERMSFALDFIIKDNKVMGGTGVAHAATEKSAPVKTSSSVVSQIVGEVDEKGNITATWSYRDEIREPSGAVYASILGAPLTGSIKDGAVQGAFSCESKPFKNDVAARNPQDNRSSAAFATQLFAYAFKDAPGAWTAQRAK